MVEWVVLICVLMVGSVPFIVLGGLGKIGGVEGCPAGRASARRAVTS
jgi:hypothetical protein